MKGDERNEKFGFSHNNGTCSLLRNEAVQSRSGNKIEKGIYSDTPSAHYLEITMKKYPYGVFTSYIGTVGYVANSTYTVYSGTYSAGRLYDKIGECACAKIILITHSSAVAEVIEGCPSENMGECVFE